MSYISREKLLAFPLRRNGEHCDMEHANPHFLNGIETAMEYAETLPTEDVSPVVHGRWVEDTHSNGSYDAECSICSESIKWSGCMYNFNYCPNCGAKMDLTD